MRNILTQTCLLIQRYSILSHHSELILQFLLTLHQRFLSAIDYLRSQCFVLHAKPQVACDRGGFSEHSEIAREQKPTTSHARGTYLRLDALQLGCNLILKLTKFAPSRVLAIGFFPQALTPNVNTRIILFFSCYSIAFFQSLKRFAT